jgi:hypothetical protein
MTPLVASDGVNQKKHLVDQINRQNEGVGLKRTQRIVLKPTKGPPTRHHERRATARFPVTAGRSISLQINLHPPWRCR